MAKQIYSGLQQSLLERKAGRRKNKKYIYKGIGSRGVDMAKKKKKVPSGNVWKKSKGTSFGVVVVPAWLPV